MGKNMPEIEQVASAMGTKSCFVLTAAEYQRLCPFSKRLV